MDHLHEAVKKAISGDKQSLEEIVLEIQDDIYNLAIRMLWHPDDAKDATQDILIRVITNLGSFQFKSSFNTWVYRLASNSLINFQKQKKRQDANFTDFETQLNRRFSEGIHYTSNLATQNLLLEEAKVGCSNAMLQCLKRKSRLVYIIGEILGYNSTEGGAILDCSPENFRQQLSRTRKKIHAFLNRNCGIVNPSNNCKCHKKVDVSIDEGLIQPKNLLFAHQEKVANLIHAIDQIEEEVSLFQSNPLYAAPPDLMREVSRIVTTQDSI